MSRSLRIYSCVLQPPSSQWPPPPHRGWLSSLLPDCRFYPSGFEYRLIRGMFTTMSRLPLMILFFPRRLQLHSTTVLIVTVAANSLIELRLALHLPDPIAPKSPSSNATT